MHGGSAPNSFVTICARAQPIAPQAAASWVCSRWDEAGQARAEKQIVSNPGARPTSLSQSLRQIAGKRNRVADSGAADTGRADAAAIDDLSQLPDLVFREILRALPGHSHVLTVLVVVFIGEAIEFGLVPVAIAVSRFTRLSGEN
jgi:hypothetical protein